VQQEKLKIAEEKKKKEEIEAQAAAKALEDAAKLKFAVEDSEFDINKFTLTVEETNKILKISELSGSGNEGWKTLGKPTSIGGVQSYTQDEEVNDNR